MKKNQGLLPVLLAIAMLTVNQDNLTETEIGSLPDLKKLLYLDESNQRLKSPLNLLQCLLT
jgi:hypothetical protein